MVSPLMPKSTAVWLIENTSLTFDQIANFCGLHALEVQALADGEMAQGLVGVDPIVNGQLTQAEIDRCSKDPSEKLKINAFSVKPEKKGKKYTPLARRGDRPDGIAWVVKNYPDVSDNAIASLLGTTKPTIQAIRQKSHWNSPHIKPRNPVSLGLCTQPELDRVLKASGYTLESE